MFHNLHMLLRACWRKYPMGILLVVTLMMHLIGWLLMLYVIVKGSCR